MVPLENDPHSTVQGVLLSDEILYYVENHKLIEPFDQKNLKPASYNVTLGDDYKRNDEPSKLDEHNPELVIKPHESVLIQTKETLRLPRNLIGHWNPRISMIFNGLVYVGGVHIDPGWDGQLWCPVYNLSKKTIKIRRGEAFASVDFVKTTPFHKGDCVEYQQSWKEPHHPGSGLEDIRADVTNFRAELEKYRDEFRSDLESYRSRLEGYQSLTFTIVGIIVAAVTIIATSPFLRTPPNLAFPDWTGTYLLVLIATTVVTFPMSLLALRYSRRGLVRGKKNAEEKHEKQ